MYFTPYYTKDNNLEPTGPGMSLGGGLGDIVFSDTEDRTDLLFPDVSPAEALAGSTRYRALMIKNTSGHNLTSVAAVLNGSSLHTTIGYELVVSSRIQVITLDTSAPAAVVFPVFPSTLAIGNIADNDYFGLWFKRVIPNTSTGKYNIPVIFTVSGTYTPPTGAPVTYSNYFEYIYNLYEDIRLSISKVPNKSEYNRNEMLDLLIDTTNSGGTATDPAFGVLAKVSSPQCAPIWDRAEKVATGQYKFSINSLHSRLWRDFLPSGYLKVQFFASSISGKSEEITINIM